MILNATLISMLNRNATCICKNTRQVKCLTFKYFKIAQQRKTIFVYNVYELNFSLHLKLLKQTSDKYIWEMLQDAHFQTSQQLVQIENIVRTFVIILHIKVLTLFTNSVHVETVSKLVSVVYIILQYCIFQYKIETRHNIH